MNNAQTSVIIKKLCKKQNISISKMLAETSIRKSLIYDMEKRDYTPSAEILEKIADYLNCSVDYLLGRTDSPNTTASNNINSVSIVNGSNGNYSPLTVNGKPSSNDDTDELVDLVKGLPLVKRAEAVLYLNELKNKK